MRFIVWNMSITAWLLLSAFILPQSADSAALSGLFAVLIATFAFASPGLLGLRFVNTVLALILGWAALLLDDVGGLARVSNALVAAAVFALSIVPGRSTIPPEERPAPDPRRARPPLHHGMTVAASDGAAVESAPKA